MPRRKNETFWFVIFNEPLGVYWGLWFLSRSIQVTMVLPHYQISWHCYKERRNLKGQFLWYSFLFKSPFHYLFMKWIHGLPLLQMPCFIHLTPKSQGQENLLWEGQFLPTQTWKQYRQIKLFLLLFKTVWGGFSSSNFLWFYGCFFLPSLQDSLEDISYLLRIPQRKPYGTMEGDVKKAMKACHLSPLNCIWYLSVTLRQYPCWIEQ